MRSGSGSSNSERAHKNRGTLRPPGVLTAETSERLLGGGRRYHRYHRMGLQGGDRRPLGAGCGRRGTALALADGDRLEAVLAQDRVGETELPLEIRAHAGPDLVTLDQGL